MRYRRLVVAAGGVGIQSVDNRGVDSGSEICGAFSKRAGTDGLPHDFSVTDGDVHSHRIGKMAFVKRDDILDGGLKLSRRVCDAGVPTEIYCESSRTRSGRSTSAAAAAAAMAAVR